MAVSRFYASVSFKQGAPSPSACARQLKCSEKPVTRCFKIWRSIECTAGDVMARKQTLRGNLEVDGHSMGTIVVSATNPFHRKTIDEAKARKPQGRDKHLKDYSKIKTWLMHVRVAGCMQRAGLAVIRPMPQKVVPLGSSPPKESLADIKAAQVQNRGTKGSFVFGDGAKCFENEAALLQQHYESVSHAQLQFVKEIPEPKPGQSSLAGTQAIDSTWEFLDKYSAGIKVSTKMDGRTVVNPQVWVYMYSFVWRLNMQRAGEDLWVSLGALCKCL